MTEKIKTGLDTPPTGPSRGFDTEHYKEKLKKALEGFKTRDEAIAYFAESMGSDLHEEWRKTRLKEDGTYEPRWKKSKDAEWTAKHGTDDVDIANTPFAELPSNRKYENLEAAKVAIDLVFDKVIAGEEITDEMIEQMASVVHKKWKDRNSWVKDSKEKGGNPILARPYSKLPDKEKEKDRAQIRQAIAKIKSSYRKFKF